MDLTRRQAITLGIGVLALVAAVGVFVWILGPDTSTVRAGSFTQLDDGASIGADEAALEEPIEVQTTWVDPSSEQAFTYLDHDIEGSNRALEISARAEDPIVVANPGSPFVIALPVPDTFDKDRLAGVVYDYGTFVFPRHDHEDPPDVWTYKQGYYHAEEDVFVMTVPSVGTSEHPTRVAVVEHAFQQTQRVEGPLDDLRTVSSPDGDEAVTELSLGLSFEEHVEPTSHYRISADVPGADGFQIHCYVEDCSPLSDRAIIGVPIAERLNTVQNALQGASAVYSDLAEVQEPWLEREDDLYGMGTTYYTFHLHGPIQEEDPDPSADRCAGFSGGGWYNPNSGIAAVCLNTNRWVNIEGHTHSSLDVMERTVAHELFHAYQRGYTFDADDPAVTEATSALTQDWWDPTSLSRWHFQPPIHHSTTDLAYRMEYLFHHLFVTEGLTFEDMGHLFDQGLDLEGADRFIESSTTKDGFGDAYWAFVKDLVYEGNGPPLREPDTSGPCQLFEGNTPLNDQGPYTITPPAEPWPIHDYTVRIDPADLEVDVSGAHGDENTIKPPPSQASSTDVYQLDFRPPDGAQWDHYWVSVRLDAPESDDPDMRMKLYDLQEPGSQACDQDHREVLEVGGSASMDLWDGDEEGILIVSNADIDEDEDVEYELVFKACPIWPMEGANEQRSYGVVGCYEPDGTITPVQITQMGPPLIQGVIDALGLPTLPGVSFQGSVGSDAPEPGEMIWRESGSDMKAGGGITRPSFAYDQVYTVFGLGGVGDVVRSGAQQPGMESSHEIPAGRVTAFDAETGEEAWMATDENLEMDIAGFQPIDYHMPLDMLYQPIVGNDLVYVQGAHMDELPDLSPQGDDPVPMFSHGILAFDAHDGSLAWETKPEHDPRREAPNVDTVVLCQDTLYVTGSMFAPGYYVGSDSRQDWVPTPPEYTPKLWELDAITGETKASRNLPTGDASVAIHDCTPTIAGFASPGNLTMHDPDTGDVAWQLDDIFDPPPDENLTVHTSAITELALAEETVFVGTTIMEESDRRGKMYAFNEHGEAWAYELDVPAPDPVVVNETVYLLTHDADVNTDHDGEDPSDVVDMESKLHALDAATGEPRWVVDASTTMTVTPQRIYVGKLGPLGDPTGGSVSALDSQTGEVLWTNEEDITAPMALTGAFANGVLYVQAGGQTIALEG